MTPVETDAQARKQFWIKPGFQKKMMMIIILVVIIAVNIAGGIAFGLITATIEGEFLADTTASLDPSQVAVMKEHLFQYLFPKVLLAELIAILILAFLTLRLTHHIAGPVYRLEQNMLAMASGNWGLRTAFRTRDEFLELAEALNGLGDAFCGHLDSLREQVDQLSQMDLSSEQSKKLEEMRTLLEGHEAEVSDS